MSPSVTENWKYPEHKPGGMHGTTLLTAPLTPRPPKPLQTKRLPGGHLLSLPQPPPPPFAQCNRTADSQSRVWACSQQDGQAKATRQDSGT